jgi:MYXO-CTERM domain-containing protein
VGGRRRWPSKTADTVLTDLHRCPGFVKLSGVKTYIAVALVLATLAPLSACGPVTSPSVCDLRRGEILVFPTDFSTNVPVDAVVRVLVGDDADDLFILLVDDDIDRLEPGREAFFRTTFGDVLEFTPDFELVPNTRYTVEVVDDFDRLITSSSFRTGSVVETGGNEGFSSQDILLLDGQDRACCTTAGCDDGTQVTVSGLDNTHFSPQLVLLNVEEVFNAACGPAIRQVGVIPVVWDPTRSEQPIIAETDLFLDGCYEITTVSQTLRSLPPTEATCSNGQPFQPLPATDECRDTTQGCQCGAGVDPASTTLWALLLVGWFAWRRRRALRT